MRNISIYVYKDKLLVTHIKSDYVSKIHLGNAEQGSKQKICEIVKIRKVFFCYSLFSIYIYIRSFDGDVFGSR